MERRTLPAYRAVFRLVKDVCPHLDPAVIITDWEYPQQAAWLEAFPSKSLSMHISSHSATILNLFFLV